MLLRHFRVNVVGPLLIAFALAAFAVYERGDYRDQIIDIKERQQRQFVLLLTPERKPEE